MQRVLKLILRHPIKLWTALLCLCSVYGYARILVLQYVVGAALHAIRRYPANFPHSFFFPLFYSSVTVAFFAAIYHDLVVLHSGAWKYVLPLPMAVRGRLYRIVGVPLYAFVIGVAEAIQVFRNPFMKSDLSRLAAYVEFLGEKSFLDDHALRTIMYDIKWNAWWLKTDDPSTFAYVRLPVDMTLALVVCFVYGISLFCSVPRHDGDELRDATRNHDIVRVRQILARGTHPNSRGGDGSTALHICAQQAMCTLAKTLLEHKADPNARDRLGFTPLHWAVQMRREEVSNTNRLEMIRLLLANGANANQSDANGRTPLMIAQKNENGPALRVLREVLGDADTTLDSSASSTVNSDSSSSDSTMPTHDVE